MAQQRVIVVGGGLAGLAGSVRLAEAGIAVDLFSIVPVKRSHSVCAQGGINACNDVARQQGYSEYEHFDETIYGGDFLADQHPVLEMANWAPKIIDLLDRMGVPFNRTSEGFRDLRLFGGSLFKRTHFAGATTGQQLLYALDEQTRRFESEGKVTKYEAWEFLRPVVEDGRCVGIVAQDMRTMQIRAFRADAVVMATGGCGLVYGKSTNSIICTGAAAARCFQAGAWYGNPEMIQVHPTAIPGADKLRLMSESARGEGGRVWVPRKKGETRRPKDIPEAERYYFLEERYPAYGNIVPRDIATREIFSVCVDDGMGVNGENSVYLDLTHKPKEYLQKKLEGILEIYSKFAGEDPYTNPMKIFPAVHYSMGGLYTTFAKGRYNPTDPRTKHKSGSASPLENADVGQGMALGEFANASTNIPGLYAFGEVNFAYHGANRLGANALLSCLFDGLGRELHQGWSGEESPVRVACTGRVRESRPRRGIPLQATRGHLRPRRRRFHKPVRHPQGTRRRDDDRVHGRQERSPPQAVLEQARRAEGSVQARLRSGLGRVDEPDRRIHPLGRRHAHRRRSDREGVAGAEGKPRRPLPHRLHRTRRCQLHEDHARQIRRGFRQRFDLVCFHRREPHQADGPHVRQD
jgi:succinate dehydrogenase / fumarate reductase flavoprotein subunit